MIRCLALAVTLALASAPLAATTYTFEPRHTEGVIRWDHLGFSKPTAQFTGVEGSLQFDAADPLKASAMVTIPLANLSSGVPDLDENFRSADFFDIAKYPVATFKSTKVEQGGMPGRLKVTGDLSLHGVTRPVILDVTINKVGPNPRMHLESVGFDAMTTLKRSDFGLGLYIPQVSDEVSIHITSQADEAKGYAEHMKAVAAEEAAEAKAAASKK
jgi:polyisoprenoid-binding protein YceI